MNLSGTEKIFFTKEMNLNRADNEFSLDQLKVTTVNLRQTTSRTLPLLLLDQPKVTDKALSCDGTVGYPGHKHHVERSKASTHWDSDKHTDSSAERINRIETLLPRASLGQQWLRRSGLASNTVTDCSAWILAEWQVWDQIKLNYREVESRTHCDKMRDPAGTLKTIPFYQTMCFIY